jgi:hypothetical protein
MPESDVLQKKPRKRGRLLVFATLAVLLLCCVPPVWNYYRVAAVQDALNRDYEIIFGSAGRPEAMPEVLDKNLEKFLVSEGVTWDRVNPDIVYGERVRAMFRGSIAEIHIYYHEGIRGDLGTALLRFPQLKKLTVYENDSNPADYKLLCQRIRQLPDLEEVELGGQQITSDVLAELAGHPKLSKLNISLSGLLTTDVLETLKELPALKVFELGEIYGPDEKEWTSPALLARFRAALPGVAVKLPEPRK